MTRSPDVVCSSELLKSKKLNTCFVLKPMPVLRTDLSDDELDVALSLVNDKTGREPNFSTRLKR